MNPPLKRRRGLAGKAVATAALRREKTEIGTNGNGRASRVGSLYSASYREREGAGHRYRHGGVSWSSGTRGSKGHGR